MSIIYLDSAASTWHKPPVVKKMMAEVIEDFAANPERGGHALEEQVKSVSYASADSAVVWHSKPE